VVRATRRPLSPLRSQVILRLKAIQNSTAVSSGITAAIDELMYMPHDKEYDAFLMQVDQLYFVFNEDDDDHRWERVEMYYPMHGYREVQDIDLYSTKAWRRSNFAEDMVGAQWRPEKPGIRKPTPRRPSNLTKINSGCGKLYVGVF